VTVVSALLLAAVVALIAAAVGAAVGAATAPRLIERRRRRAAEQAGLTVSQMLAHVVAQSPLGIVVVDGFRDVVYSNDRARELGLVRDRTLDEQAWQAAERTLATGADTVVDLTPAKRDGPGRPVLSVRAHVRLLTEGEQRFAVVYGDDQSEYARMEATRRDFVANVSHELKTPVAAMAVLAEALLASGDDPEVVRHFAERLLAESTRLANMVTELIDLWGRGFQLLRLRPAPAFPEPGLMLITVTGVWWIAHGVEGLVFRLAAPVRAVLMGGPVIEGAAIIRAAGGGCYSRAIRLPYGRKRFSLFARIQDVRSAG